MENNNNFIKMKCGYCNTIASYPIGDINKCIVENCGKDDKWILDITCNHREIKLIMDIAMSPNKIASCLACGVEIEIIKPNLLIHNFIVKGQKRDEDSLCDTESCLVCTNKTFSWIKEAI